MNRIVRLVCIAKDLGNLIDPVTVTIKQSDFQRAVLSILHDFGNQDIRVFNIRVDQDQFARLLLLVGLIRRVDRHLLCWGEWVFGSRIWLKKKTTIGNSVKKNSIFELFHDPC